MNNAVETLGTILCYGGGTILSLIIILALFELVLYVYADVREKFILTIRGEKMILEYIRNRDDYIVYRDARKKWERAWIDAANAHHICISPETIQKFRDDEMEG